MRRAPLIVAALLALGLGACGDGDGRPTLKVSAAASLKQAFEDYGDEFSPAATSFSFAGSDELAAQIRRGAKPDVYAAANEKLPAQLFDRGLVEKPVVFASNRLVIAVPAGDRKVRSVDDLAARGVQIAAGAPGVPVGDYAREAIERLPASEAQRIEANIRSNEPDVLGVVGKVSQRAVDAGFVYVTDVEASGGRLKAVPLPAGIAPLVPYAAGVVTGTQHGAQAREFITGLLARRGARALREAGFEPPPR